MSALSESNYYKSVQNYYNEDASNFEERYWKNASLQKIRESFRAETVPKFTKNILEIGFGPGVDIVYFAQKFPKSKVHGVDISDGMHQHAQQEVDKAQLTNVLLKVGSVEDIETLFPNQKFDLIYVYFGALNSVEDLQKIPEYLEKALDSEGEMVLTFVNKWYLMSILKPLLKLKVKTATKRLGKIWGGYSPQKFLASRCYSSRNISRAFSPSFSFEKRRGYSILFPAWYENHIYLNRKSLCERLWKIDHFLQRTPFWNLGEYTLYVLKKNAPNATSGV